MFRPIHFVPVLSILLSAAACTAAPSTPTQSAAPTAVPKPTAAPAISASPSVAVGSASPAAAPSPSRAAEVVVPAASVAASPSAAVVSASPTAPSGTTAAESASLTGLRVVGVQPGAVDTTITIQNDSATASDLTGWSLVIGTVSIRLPGNARVEPGGRLVLHTSSGTSNGQDMYLAQDVVALAAALQPGAVVVLQDANGTGVTQTRIP